MKPIMLLGGAPRSRLRGSSLLGWAMLLVCCAFLCQLTVMKFYDHDCEQWELGGRSLRLGPSQQSNGKAMGPLYFVRTSRERSAQVEMFYQAWGRKAAHIVYASDSWLNASIPLQLQRTFLLPHDSLRRHFMASGDKAAMAERCARNLVLLGEVLREAQWKNISWLVVLDDETFVLERNLLDHLKAFRPKEPHYVGLTYGEPHWHHVNGSKVLLKTAMSSGGFALSRGLLDWLARDAGKIFSRTSAYRLCQQADYWDDVALGRLITFRYFIRLQDRRFHRPDWRQIKKEDFDEALTMHVGLRSGAIDPDGLDVLRNLTSISLLPPKKKKNKT